ncbi:18700_t:CDS:1, partial [Funneliformis geosporum]
LSWNGLTNPNEVHQTDVLYTQHVKSKRTIYFFYLNVVDITSRYKATILIGVALRGSAKSIKNMQ